MPHDEFHPAYARELGRLVAGFVVEVGDNEQGIEERVVTVARLKSVVVGVDSHGLGCGLNVVDTGGDEWTLYSDGTVADVDDRQVGRHRLRASVGDPWIAMTVDGPDLFRVCDWERDYSTHATYDEAKRALAEMRLASASLRVAS